MRYAGRSRWATELYRWRGVTQGRLAAAGVDRHSSSSGSAWADSPLPRASTMSESSLDAVTFRIVHPSAMFFDGFCAHPVEARQELGQPLPKAPSCPPGDRWQPEGGMGRLPE